MLCFSLDRSKAQAIPAIPYYVVDSKLDPIKYIFEKLSLLRRIARWQVLLSEYDIQYVSYKAIKKSAIADFQVDRTEEEYEPMKFEFLDEDLLAIFQIKDEST